MERLDNVKNKVAKEIFNSPFDALLYSSHEKSFIDQVAIRYASESIKDYKEKLKIVLVRHWHKKTGDEIYDLIDQPLPEID